MYKLKKINLSKLLYIIISLGLLGLTACDSLQLASYNSTEKGKRPDLDCIIANDFYVVHFSSYLVPSNQQKAEDAKSAFVPYCQKIPSTGKVYFTADLIDRDIRATPIAIKLVEIEKIPEKNTDEVKEIRTVLESAAKLYPRGAVEVQADIEKKGNYLLLLLIGEAIEEDDKFRIPFEVGVDPNPLPYVTILIIIASVLFVLALILFVYRLIKKRKK